VGVISYILDLDVFKIEFFNVICNLYFEILSILLYFIVDYKYV